MVLSTIGDARRGSERRKEGSSSRGPARLGVPSTLSSSAAAKRCAPALTRATSRSTRRDAGRGSERSWKEGSSRGPARLGVPSTSLPRAALPSRAAVSCRASRSAMREAVRSASRARSAARGSSRTPLAASSSRACASPAAMAAASCGCAPGSGGYRIQIGAHRIRRRESVRTGFVGKNAPPRIQRRKPAAGRRIAAKTVARGRGRKEGRIHSAFRFQPARVRPSVRGFRADGGWRRARPRQSELFRPE